MNNFRVFFKDGEKIDLHCSGPLRAREMAMKKRKTGSRKDPVGLEHIKKVKRIG